MRDASLQRPMARLHPLHSIILAFPLPLSVGAVLSDIAYRNSFHVQWANFSAWLVAGAVTMTTLAVIWALVDVVRAHAVQRAGAALYLVVLLVLWGLGFVNSLVHAKDAWAMMPEGLYLSAAMALLALVAAWMGYSRDERRVVS